MSEDTKKAKPLDSYPNGLDSLVSIGKVVKPRGIRGELKVLLMCDGPKHFVECLDTGTILLWKDRPAVVRGRPTVPGKQNSPKPQFPSTDHPLGPINHLESDLREPTPLGEIEGLRFHGGMALLKLPFIDSCNDAERLRDCVIGLREEDLPAANDGQFYYHQLTGLKVVETEGTTLGQVQSVLESPGNDQLIVQPSDLQERIFMIPFIKHFVKTVDLKNSQIVVELPTGFIDSQH